MKQISTACLLLFFSISSMAQSLDDINNMMGKQQFKEAKTAIDAFLANPKNSSKGDAWYYKGRVIGLTWMFTTVFLIWAPIFTMKKSTKNHIMLSEML